MPANQKPSIRSTQLKTLEKLSNASGVSGDEGAIRKIVLHELQDFSADAQVDALGNVLIQRQGKGPNRLRVMLAAHMDEVGFMLTSDEGDGLFRFGTVGGLDLRQLVGKPVWVGKDQLPGVIGAKPIHLSSAGERQSSIPLDSLRIDIGPNNGSKAKVGDRACFATRFQRQGPSLLGKALDDRLGVATLIELVRHAPENIDLLAAFTVQEEVGLRGAHVAAYALDPDLALALDCTPANDLPGWDDEPNTRYNARLGHGPALYIADRATLSDPRLVQHFISTAKRAGIPYQLRQAGGGGTDAGAIHRQRAGIPSLSISVPARSLHTAVGIARLADWKDSLALIHTALAALPADILATPR